MRHNTAIEELYVSAPGDSDGLLPLLEALLTNTVIRVLELYHMQLHLHPLATDALSTLLEHSQSIRRCDLTATYIGDQGVGQGCKAVALSNTLEELHLAENEMGEESAQHIRELLKVNTSLTTLNLQENEIGDEGTVHVAAGLLENRTLRELNLIGCGIREKGAAAISSILETNSTMTHLNVYCNNLGTAGIKSFAEALKKNRGLKYLNVGVNDYISLLVKKAFIETSLYNVTLVDLKPFICKTVTVGFLARNKELIPAAVRRAALLIIGIRRNVEGMGAFRVCPKDIVRMIAMEVWATRTDPIWIRAIQ